MTMLQSIPLNRLRVSRANVRRTDRRADIDALAASIGAHGLLQNLAVSPAQDGKFDVVAGARRLAALKALAKSGAIARDFPVPCQIVEPDSAPEVSLAENVQRIAMDAMDEVEAFAALAASGHGAADIARRFGQSERHVVQRLALAALSPKLKAAYRRGDLSLDAARAFCLAPDHARQEAVFRSLAKPVTQAGTVRTRLMAGCMRHDDRIAVFAGLDAYEAAGGAVTRDLFDPRAVYVDDPALMTQLAHDRLDALRADALAEGWGWVELSLHPGVSPALHGARLRPAERAMTADEAATAARLEAEIAALEDSLDDAAEDDPRWEALDAATADREALRAALLAWDPTLMRHAGVVLAIGHDGALIATRGVVRKANQKRIAELQRARAGEGADLGADVGALAGDEDAPGTDAHDAPGRREGPLLPRAVMLALTGERTRAIRLGVARDPRLGLALAVHALARSILSHKGARGLSLRASDAGVEDHAELATARAELAVALPDDEAGLLDWCLMQETPALSSSLAVLVASTLDLTHAGAGADDDRLQAMGDALARAADIDMRDHWRADAAFLASLPKALLMETLARSASVTALTPSAQATHLKAQAKLRKPELALAVEKALASERWLPAPLQTPPAEARYELTEAGLAALAASAA